MKRLSEKESARMLGMTVPALRREVGSQRDWKTRSPVSSQKARSYKSKRHSKRIVKRPVARRR